MPCDTVWSATYVFQNYFKLWTSCMYTHSPSTHYIRLSKWWLQGPCRSECCGFVQIEENMYVCTWLWCKSVIICKYLWHCFIKSTCVEEEGWRGVRVWRREEEWGCDWIVWERYWRVCERVLSKYSFPSCMNYIYVHVCTCTYVRWGQYQLILHLRTFTCTYMHVYMVYVHVHFSHHLCLNLVAT